ncbi:MAG: ATP-dependent Clp protease proteolytic subunit [Clostridia bacterium]|nr:ATP-dependent Clp protease proteolytic subunit [Clostridia bacterium]MBO5786292.1 ATP-dependent Clp protease proteolytic subunit [Clostridia bacterium]
MSLVPMVIEQTTRGERSYDIFSRLLNDRVVFIGEAITDTVASLVVAQLLYLESVDSEREISLYINSPGGSISAGMAIYDTMKFIKCPVSTICIGMCASMAAVLLACGDKGRRIALPHSKIMIHQPLINGHFQDQTTNLEIEAAEMQRIRKMLNELLAGATGKDVSVIESDTDRNNYMDAYTAKEYGIVDKVLEKRE